MEFLDGSNLGELGKGGAKKLRGKEDSFFPQKILFVPPPPQGVKKANKMEIDNFIFKNFPLFFKSFSNKNSKYHINVVFSCTEWSSVFSRCYKVGMEIR